MSVCPAEQRKREKGVFGDVLAIIRAVPRTTSRAPPPRDSLRPNVPKPRNALFAGQARPAVRDRRVSSAGNARSTTPAQGLLRRRS